MSKETILHIHLPKDYPILTMDGLTARLDHPAQIEFDRPITRDEAAHFFVAAGRIDLLAALDHKDDKGRRVIYTTLGEPMTIDEVVIAEKVKEPVKEKVEEKTDEKKEVEKTENLLIREEKPVTKEVKTAAAKKTTAKKAK